MAKGGKGQTKVKRTGLCIFVVIFFEAKMSPEAHRSQLNTATAQHDKPAKKKEETRAMKREKKFIHDSVDGEV